MKFTSEILRRAALLVFFIAFMACSNDDGQDVSAAAEELTAEVAGLGSFTASRDFDTIAATKVAAGSANVVVVQGTDNSGRGFQLRITTYTGPGTYNLGPLIIANTATWIGGVSLGQQYSTAYSGTSGKITISAEDGKRIEGTFEFVGKINNTSASVTVTNGKFKANF